MTGDNRGDSVCVSVSEVRSGDAASAAAARHCAGRFDRGELGGANGEVVGFPADVSRFIQDGQSTGSQSGRVNPPERCAVANWRGSEPITKTRTSNMRTGDKREDVAGKSCEGCSEIK